MFEMHQLIIRCIFFIILVLEISSKLIRSPELNTIVESGKKLMLHCTTNLSEYVRWSFIPVGGNDETDIFNNGELLNSNKYEISMLRINGRYDLIIKAVEMSDAGTYSCHDDDGFGEFAVASLSVLRSNPSCSQNNSENISEGGIISISCKFVYYGPIQPAWQWKNYDRQLIQDLSTIIKNDDDYSYEVESNILVVATSSSIRPYKFTLNVEMFTIQNGNIIQKNCEYVWKSLEISILFPVRNVRFRRNALNSDLQTAHLECSKVTFVGEDSEIHGIRPTHNPTVINRAKSIQSRLNKPTVPSSFRTSSLSSGSTKAKIRLESDISTVLKWMGDNIILLGLIAFTFVLLIVLICVVCICVKRSRNRRKIGSLAECETLQSEDSNHFQQNVQMSNEEMGVGIGFQYEALKFTPETSQHYQSLESLHESIRQNGHLDIVHANCEHSLVGIEPTCNNTCYIMPNRNNTCLNENNRYLLYSGLG